MKNIIIILTVTFVVKYVYGQSSTCSLDRFQCKSGQCIASELLCDGRPDCQDQSDETSTECTKPEITCPEYAFRCAYGACVDGDKTCNGVKDCIDNSDETLSRCTRNQYNVSTTCSKDQFRCDNEQCIPGINLCDGIAQCADNSDETFIQCGAISCSQLFFRCQYGACIDGDLKCNGAKDCADGSDEDPRLCSLITETTISTNLPTPVTPAPWTPKPRESCITPPQPQNGYRKLHKSHSQCVTGEDCDIEKGVPLEPGSHLVYTCNSGYKIKGSADVVCVLGGIWLNIPVCIEIRCKSLQSASIYADCTYDDIPVPCESPLPRTIAEVSCRYGYIQEQTSSSSKYFKCNQTGQWEPELIRCIPRTPSISIYINETSVLLQTDIKENNLTSIEILEDKIVIYRNREKEIKPDIDIRFDNESEREICGVIPPQSKPLIVHGVQANITEFPWHATLYMTKTPNAPKEFICGATIIKENFLITAAHCVFDHTIKKVNDASNYYVATGNIYRDYDSPAHSSSFVKKAKVKNIYMYCYYLGVEGNYARDIAILEITEPFVFTNVLLPACLGTSNNEIILEGGITGKVAGFGLTAFGQFSYILQSLTVPYVPFNQCGALTSNYDNTQFITLDKFCAGYTNGSAVCQGDSGGGLVFRKRNQWFLKGIVSVSAGKEQTGGTKSCASTSYTLYTNVDYYLTWIRDVIQKVETNKRPPSCST